MRILPRTEGRGTGQRGKTGQGREGMETLGVGSKELHYSNMAFREYLVEVGFWKRRAPGRRVWHVLTASFRIVVVSPVSRRLRRIL